MEKPRIGIPGIEMTAWGEHVCVFFYTKEELLKLTVPYIKAGLEDNEFCMWITGEPITVKDAVHALAQSLPNVQEYLANKQLEILSHTQCYFSTGIFDAEVVLYNWLNQARGAEAKGFAGTRITGNIFWLGSEQDWEQFGAYEQAVTENIKNQRVLALCTYPFEICRINNVMQTLASHNKVLISQNESWLCHDIPPPYRRRDPLS